MNAKIDLSAAINRILIPMVEEYNKVGTYPIQPTNVGAYNFFSQILKKAIDKLIAEVYHSRLYIQDYTTLLVSDLKQDILKLKVISAISYHARKHKFYPASVKDRTRFQEFSLIATSLLLDSMLRGVKDMIAISMPPAISPYPIDDEDDDMSIMAQFKLPSAELPSKKSPKSSEAIHSAVLMLVTNLNLHDDIGE